MQQLRWPERLFKNEKPLPASIIDSKIFGGLFSDAAMRQVGSDENRAAKYLDIERALAKVQGQLGMRTLSGKQRNPQGLNLKWRWSFQKV
jgi:hypothetical protein